MFAWWLVAVLRTHSKSAPKRLPRVGKKHHRSSSNGCILEKTSAFVSEGARIKMHPPVIYIYIYTHDFSIQTCIYFKDFPASHVWSPQDRYQIAALDFQVVHFAAVRFTIYQYKTSAQIISNPIWPHHRWWLVEEIYVQICKGPNLVWEMYTFIFSDDIKVI